MTLSVNSSTGQATITAQSRLRAGNLQREVRRRGIERQHFRRLPERARLCQARRTTAVKLLAASDTGSSNSDSGTKLNNTPGNTLQFEVSGTVAGAAVQVFADSVLIGQAVATGATTVVTTNGNSTIADGEVADYGQANLARRTRRPSAIRNSRPIWPAPRRRR